MGALCLPILWILLRSWRLLFWRLWLSHGGVWWSRIAVVQSCFFRFLSGLCLLVFLLLAFLMKLFAYLFFEALVLLVEVSLCSLLHRSWAAPWCGRVYL